MDNTTILVTTIEPDTHGGFPVYWGYISCVIAIFFFGSNFVPVKKFETGDGMFFQWVCCIGIWFVGLCVHLFRYPDSTFFPLAMLGGFLWSSGNIMVVPVIKTIGLGQGILVWGSFNLMIGWASGRFGWFGLTPEIPRNTTLNYVGMGLCLISAIIYIFLKTDVHGKVEPIEQIVNDTSTDPLLDNENLDNMVQTTISDETQTAQHSPETFIDKLSKRNKRIVGIVMSMISGLLYGVNFAPVIYIQDNYSPKPSQNGLDYIFAHFSGILATSTAYLVIYCAYMQNKPRVYPQVVLPALVSGLMWGIADAGWFVANSVLSEAVSFPIVTTGPGMIGCLWGLFFKEISGIRNYVILVVAFSVTITGGILTGLSK